MFFSRSAAFLLTFTVRDLFPSLGRFCEFIISPCGIKGQFVLISKNEVIVAFSRTSGSIQLSLWGSSLALLRYDPWFSEFPSAYNPRSHTRFYNAFHFVYNYPHEYR